MRRINDDALLRRHAEEFALNELFDNWDRLDVQLVSFERGETVPLLTPPDGTLYYIVKGRSTVKFITYSGSEILFASPGAETLLGDLEFCGIEATLHCIADSDMLCIAIPMGRNMEALNSDIKFMRSLISSLVVKLRSNLRYAYADNATPLRSKIATYILTNEQDGILRPNWSRTAEIMRCSYRQLMRILAGMVEDGLIRKGEKAGSYIIEDKDTLDEIASEIYGI